MPAGDHHAAANGQVPLGGGGGDTGTSRRSVSGTAITPEQEQLQPKAVDHLAGFDGAAGQADADATLEQASAAAAAVAQLGQKKLCPKLGQTAHAVNGGGGRLGLTSTTHGRLDVRHTRRRVVLRVEVASKGQARLLTYSMWALNLLFVGTAAALFTSRERNLTLGQLTLYYTAEIALGGVCLAIHMVLLFWFIFSIRRSRREGRVWTKRQGYFTRTAAMLLALQIPYSATFVAAFAAVLSTDDCSYPWKLLAVLEFVQWVFFTSLMLFLLARLHNMTLWRGKGALDMHPDFRLMVDRPPHQLVKSHKAMFLAVWLILLGLSTGSMIDKLSRTGLKSDEVSKAGCSTPTDEWQCGAANTQIIVALTSFALILVYCAFWGYWMWRALKDHAALPYSHYRSTLIFVRVQLRVVTPVLVAVVVSVLFLSVLPAFKDSCWATVDSQMVGNLPVDMALTVATCVITILYMPKGVLALDSPVLQEFLQTFSWTLAGKQAAVEERNQLLMDTEGAAEPPDTAAEAEASKPQRLYRHLEEELTQGLAKLAGRPDVQQAAQHLRDEPMFCFETAVKLFFWMRLAYRDDDALTHPFVNAKVALPLFDVDHFETIWDDTTDTHAVLGWSQTQVVISFRGTQSIQNVMTDLKAWMAPLQPPRKRQGRTVRVHAGFLKAWLHDGFNEKVLARLQELEAATATPLRFWIAGHSLGGALAMLAALEIQREHPDSQLTCYVYGCPRVGNSAFAEEFDQAVPDTWALINGLDPIPWVPGFGFTRAGNRVSINAKGDLILRPTYFELSVVHRGASARHHLTGSYALSFAAVLRAQFVASKAMAGGPEGVTSLVASVDLAKCLVLSNMDLDSLSSPAKESQPVLLEVLAARAANQAAQATRGPLVRAGSGLLPPGCCACAKCAIGCLPLGSWGTRTGTANISADRAAEQQAVAEGGGEGDVPPVPSPQQRRWWRHHDQQQQQQQQQQQARRHMDDGDAPAASGQHQVAAGRRSRRLKPSTHSVQSKRYATFRLGQFGDDAALGIAPGTAEQQQPADGPDRQPEPSSPSAAEPLPAAGEPAAASRDHEAASQVEQRRRSVDGVSVALQAEERQCSLASALTDPEQVLELDPAYSLESG